METWYFSQFFLQWPLWGLGLLRWLDLVDKITRCYYVSNDCLTFVAILLEPLTLLIGKKWRYLSTKILILPSFERQSPKAAISPSSLFISYFSIFSTFNICLSSFQFLLIFQNQYHHHHPFSLSSSPNRSSSLLEPGTQNWSNQLILTVSSI